MPLSEIEEVAVQQSDVKGFLEGELQLKGFRPSLKPDWANFIEHVVIERTGGKIRRILPTPGNPLEFKEMLDKGLVRG